MPSHTSDMLNGLTAWWRHQVETFSALLSTIVYSTVYSGTDERKHQSSASLAFVGEFTGYRWFRSQMVSNAENVSIGWRHHILVEHGVEYMP